MSKESKSYNHANGGGGVTSQSKGQRYHYADSIRKIQNRKKMGRYPDKIQFWSSVVSMSAQPLRGWTDIGTTLCQHSSQNRYRPEWCDVFQVPGIVRRLKVTGSRIDLLLQHGKNGDAVFLSAKEKVFPCTAAGYYVPGIDRSCYLAGLISKTTSQKLTHNFIRRP